jgi:hypothetical protein
MVLRIRMRRTPPEAAGYSGTPLAEKLGVAVAFFTSAAMLEKRLAPSIRPGRRCDWCGGARTGE